MSNEFPRAPRDDEERAACKAMAMPGGGGFCFSLGPGIAGLQVRAVCNRIPRHSGDHIDASEDGLIVCRWPSAPRHDAGTPFPEGWISICSAHQKPQRGCRLCEAGRVSEHDAGTGDEAVVVKVKPPNPPTFEEPPECDCPSLPCVHRPRGSELASEYMDDGARVVAARIARAQPFAPGTITGTRQAWLREAIACAIEGKPVPPFEEPPPSPGGEDVGALLATHLAVVESMPPGDWPCDRCRAPRSRHIDSGHEFYSREQRRAWTKQMSDSIIALAGEVERLATDSASLRAQLAAASDRYARAVADADEVRGRLVERAEAAERERDTAKQRAAELAACSQDWRTACVKAEKERAEARGKALEEAAQYMLDHGGYIYSVDPVLRVRNHGEMAAAVRALAAPAAKGGA